MIIRPECEVSDKCRREYWIVVNVAGVKSREFTSIKTCKRHSGIAIDAALSISNDVRISKGR